MSVPFLAADEVARRLSAPQAADALAAALGAGLDPEADPPRQAVELERGELLLMRPLSLHASSPSHRPVHRRVLHFVYHHGAPTPEAWYRAV